MPTTRRMASATGIPDENPASRRGTEEEPLLGRPGDAAQDDERGLQQNLYLGTAIIAQAGIWILTANVWAAVFSHDVILMSAHPTLNSAGFLLLAQSILVLQPTHTANQKKQGTLIHAILNGVSLAALYAGLIIIEYNKGWDPSHHWKSVHAYMGVVTYILLFIQGIVGFTQYYTPSLYGGVNKAKAVWKYHRMSGYIVLAMGLATICASTQTTYVETVLHLPLWSVLVASILVLLGTVPRIKFQKFGFKR